MKPYFFLMALTCIVIPFSLSACEDLEADGTGSLISKPNEQFSKITSDYIEEMAHKIFINETGISKFLKVDCDQVKGETDVIWSCYIRQTATQFKNGKYTVNPPGVGEWILTVDFSNNQYFFEK